MHRAKRNKNNIYTVVYAVVEEPLSKCEGTSARQTNSGRFFSLSDLL